MKLIILFIYLCLFVTTCNAQNKSHKGFTVKIDTMSYYVGTEKTSSLIYELHNKSNDKMLIWFTRNSTEKESDSSMIKELFFQKQKDSDFSLYQIAMDKNVEVFIPVLFDAFLKRIMPNESFTIQIINEGSITEDMKKTVFNYLNHHIEVIKEDAVLKAVPTLNEMSQIIFFQQNIISINLEKLYLKPIYKY